MKPTTDENILNNDHRQIIIWQETEDGAPEQAICCRTYADGLVGVKQHNSEIIINGEAAAAVCAAIKRLAAHKPKEK